MLLQHLPVVVASVGGAMYGIDTGIIATTLSHNAFNEYMFPPDGNDAPLTGAVVSVYNAGQCTGTFIGGWAADRFSRKRAIALACFIAIIGIVLQIAAIHVGMFIVGRLLTGVSSGIILPVVPIYISELSKPQRRGVMVSFQGMGIAIGFMAANWIGYAGLFADGNLTWRIPLATQLACPMFLLIASHFLPFSPRWLVSKGRISEAVDVLRRLRREASHDLVDHEIAQMRGQFELESSSVASSFWRGFLQLFEKRFVKRVALSCFVQALTELAGVSAIQNFQSIFYNAVGFTGNTALLISAVYGIMGVIGQLISLTLIADRWKRTTTLWVGCLTLAGNLAICMALSACFSDGSNQAAARATIAFIFLYSCTFATFFNSTVYVVAAEILPTALRSKGLSLSTFCTGVTAITMTQITPVAFEEISWRYYAVFIGTNLLGFCVYFWFLPETQGLTLEEVGAVFGDEVITGHKLEQVDTGVSEQEGHYGATIETESPHDLDIHASKLCV